LARNWTSSSRQILMWSALRCLVLSLMIWADGRQIESTLSGWRREMVIGDPNHPQTSGWYLNCPMLQCIWVHPEHKTFSIN
jgi:hypothetical protein